MDAVAYYGASLALQGNHRLEKDLTKLSSELDGSAEALRKLLYTQPPPANEAIGENDTRFERDWNTGNPE